MLQSEHIKKKAKQLGADSVGISSIERFQGAPSQMDPRQIMPEARSVIAMAFRVNRGSLRGVEEGTFFSNYSSMGYGGLTYLYIPIVVINLAKHIEDFGFEAIPYGHQSDWRAIDNEGNLRNDYSRPVEEGRAHPDVMVHLRIAAYLSGLGEIGYSKVFLTPQFGPRQRLGIVITEAELQPDPIYEGRPLCDRCKICVKECPGNAISGDETVKANIGGNDLEWAKIDYQACDIALRGGEEAGEGEEASYMEGKHIKPASISPFYKKPPNLYKTGEAICGGKGCLRACMMHLESKGILENRFDKPFRRRKPWKVDWN